MHKDLEIELDAECLIPPRNSGYNRNSELIQFEKLDPESQKNPASNVPELDWIAKLETYHHDLHDHPLISSMIWLKWNKAYPIFLILAMIKMVQHLAGFAYIFLQFGFNQQNFCNGTDTGAIQDNCIDPLIHSTIEVMQWITLAGYILNFVRVVAILLGKICT